MEASRFRDAILQLAQREGMHMAPTDLTIDRIMFDVTVGEQKETVLLQLRDSTLKAQCTSGRTDSPHVKAVLAWLSSGAIAAPSLEQVTITRVPVDEKPLTGRTSIRPSAPPPPATQKVLEGSSIADGLDDLITSIFRAGATAAESTSVQEVKQRLMVLLPKPHAPLLLRWAGRLRQALLEHDRELTARLLVEAHRMADALRSMDAESFQKKHPWFAHTPRDLRELHDVVLFEVGREWLQGWEGARLGRRYLVQLTTGDVFCEEGLLEEADGSIGTCPRLISVGFAQVETNLVPARIRLFHYAVSRKIQTLDYQKLVNLAHRDFSVLAKEYRKALSAQPGLAEPFALLAPQRWEKKEGLALVDRLGRTLPMALYEQPWLEPTLRALLEESAPNVVAGRLVDSHGILMFVPVSVGWIQPQLHQPPRWLRIA